MCEGQKAKYLASLFAFLAFPALIVHVIFGRPSWITIFGGSAIVTLSVVAVILLVPKTNYMIEAEQTS